MNKNDSHKTSRGSFGALRPTAAAIAVAACFSSAALANPTNPTVVHGTATFQQAGNILNITNSANAIINWGSFSISVGELTRFIQPSALSAVLNRVTGQDPSAILGALQSNGRVFLINPNGIVFGAGSQVDVAGLVASTLNLSNEDFLNNRMRFTDGVGAGSVVNQGQITGGSVYLVGNAVTNNGLITSPNGEVVLAAGNSVELVNPGTPNLRVEVVAGDNEARNLGTISAEAGRIGIYAGLIRNSGTLNASSAVAEGGRILLKAKKDITLESTSIIDASGQGGGEIIAFADNNMYVDGTLNASAPVSGDGGFIETSGKNRVKIADSAVISTAAGDGQTGVWLVDPNDLVIAAYGGDTTGTAIASQLASTNVVMTSTMGSGFYGGGNGDILVNDSIAWSSNNSLTLTAERNVQVSQSITNTGSGGLSLYAGWNGSGDGSSPTLTSTGDVILNAPISVNTVLAKAGKDILLQGSHTATATGGITFEPGSAGSLKFTGSPVAWIFDAPVTVAGGRPIDLVASAQVQFNNALNAVNSSVTVNNGATLALAGGATTVKSLVNLGGTVNSANTLTVSDGIDWQGGTIGGSGLLITPSGAVTDITSTVLLAPGKTWNNAGAVNISGSGTLDLGDFTAAIFNNQSGGVVNITSTAGWSFISNSSTQVGEINNAGTINVQNGTSWEAAFNNAASGILNISAGNALSMQNGKTINGTVNIGAGGTLWVSEFHASPTVFSNTTIGGTGTLQVLGSGPQARFSNVSAPGVALRLGSGGNIEIFSGTSTFAALNLDAPAYGGAFAINNGLFAQSAGDLTVPTGSDYSGNAGYWAQGGNVIAGGVVDAAYGGATIELRASGDVKILGGADVSGVQVKLQGANVFVGETTATSAASVYASSQLDVITGGLTIQGGSGANASALVSSSGALTVSASGDVVLAGGSGADSWAKLSGNPDAVLSSVGGAVRMNAGTGTNAYAIIESVSPTTIYLTFPNAGSGGYFVNGVEGVVYDAGTHTGFVAGGNPAVLGQSLKVTYGGSSSTVPSSTLELPVQTLIVAAGESKEPPDAEKDKDVFKETEDEKKKDAPVCR